MELHSPHTGDVVPQNDSTSGIRLHVAKQTMSIPLCNDADTSTFALDVHSHDCLTASIAKASNQHEGAFGKIVAPSSMPMQRLRQETTFGGPGMLISQAKGPRMLGIKERFRRKSNFGSPGTLISQAKCPRTVDTECSNVLRDIPTEVFSDNSEEDGSNPTISDVYEAISVQKDFLQQVVRECRETVLESKGHHGLESRMDRLEKSFWECRDELLSDRHGLLQSCMDRLVESLREVEPCTSWRKGQSAGDEDCRYCAEWSHRMETNIKSIEQMLHKCLGSQFNCKVETPNESHEEDTAALFPSGPLPKAKSVMFDVGFEPKSQTLPAMNTHPQALQARPQTEDYTTINSSPQTRGLSVPLDSQECKSISLAATDLQSQTTASNSQQSLNSARCLMREGVKRLQSMLDQEAEDAMKTVNSTLPALATVSTILRHEILKPAGLKSLYRKDSFFAMLLEHKCFDNFITFAVMVNCLWLGYSCDSYRDREPDLLFNVVENLFCAIFLAELFIRFMAFEHKQNVRQDSWFIFDAILLVLIILDTWVASLYDKVLFQSSITSGRPDPELAKLVRLYRLARIARVLRAIPECIVMCKCIIVSFRAVCFCGLLICIITYAFAITLSEVTQKTDTGNHLFPRVTTTMGILVSHALFPDLYETFVLIRRTNFLSLVIYTIFIILMSISLLNMLVAIMVRSVDVLSRAEKEEQVLIILHNEFCNKLGLLDCDTSSLIGVDEFAALLSNPETIKMLMHVGVDVLALADHMAFLFKDDRKYSYKNFIQMLMDLRGEKHVTVKEIVTLRMWLDGEFMDLRSHLGLANCRQYQS